MANGPKQTLMGYEINRARLRILSPIGEDISLSPVPLRPQPKEEELRYPRDHQLVLISDRLDGFEPSSPDLIPPVPSPAPIYDERSRDVDTIINRYLMQTTVPKARKSHSGAFCECCENVNSVNREKRKAYWGKLPQDSEHIVDTAKIGLDSYPFGLSKRADDRHVHEGRYEMLYPTLAARSTETGENIQEGGSATLAYPYLPRSYYLNRRYPLDYETYYDWSSRRETEPPFERHIQEDVMQAASNYDASMVRLKQTVGLFENTEYRHGPFS